MQQGILAVLATLLLQASTSIASGCEFPAFMQTNGTQRDWWGHIKEQYTEFTLRVSVDGNKLQSIATDSSAASYTWMCLQSLGRGHYLVAHEESGQQSARFTCVEFVKRSDNVVQLKKAEVSRRMNNALCSNSALKLDPWLLVDKTHIGEDEHVCALQGGFSMRVYDKVFHQDKCDAYLGEIRLESECLQGEGLYFYFRQQTCVPETLYMYSTQRTQCLANWQEGPFTYMLLRHYTHHQYKWLFRFPTKLTGSSFIAYLLMDLVADTKTPVTETNNYLRLDMVADTRQPVSSLCVDDYEICSDKRSPCTSGPQMALTCSRTCRLCNATRPNVCSFPADWQATWYDGGRLDTAAVTTDQSTLTVHGQVEEKFWCVDWDKTPLPDSSDRNTQDQMLVAEFHNGCKPRYTCARIMQHSSNAMFLKLSQTLRWPFTSTLEDPVDCSHFRYDHEENFLDNKFRNRYLRLLYAKNNMREVNCGLPSTMRNYEAQFADGTACNTSVEETASQKSLHVLMDDSCASRDQLPANIFTCVDSVKLKPSRDVLIVSEAASTQHNELFCWVFPKRSRSSFYLLSGNQCNEAARKRIHNERVSPVITFSKHRQMQDEAPKDPRDGGNTKDDPESEVNRRTKPPPPGANKTVLREEGTGVGGVQDGGEDGEDEGSNPSPYVVIAAVLIFALFQIPCLCKSTS